MRAHLILYVIDQQRSTLFYASVLNIQPTLNAPGMTEFTLSDQCVFGLMPEYGIRKLLGTRLPDPALAHGAPRSELYLHVDSSSAYFQRTLQAGGINVSPPAPRDWGDTVAYCLDLDGHVIAFASKTEIF